MDQPLFALPSSREHSPAARTKYEAYAAVVLETDDDLAATLASIPTTRSPTCSSRSPTSRRSPTAS